MIIFHANVLRSAEKGIQELTKHVHINLKLCANLGQLNFYFGHLSTKPKQKHLRKDTPPPIPNDDVTKYSRCVDDNWQVIKYCMALQKYITYVYV